jgi:hypothetical protein
MGQCYNSELPVGPQGPQGPPGQQGNTGVQGVAGPAGTNGINNFTTLKDAFQQPQSVDDPNIATTIRLENAIWVAIGSVIYIGYGPAPIAGGFYRVLNKYMNGDVNAVSVYRLSWTLPNVNFVAYPNNVFATSTVSTAGTIGASGTNGDNGINGINPYSQVVFDFDQPAVNTNITFLITDNRWLSIGQIVYISSVTVVAGFFQVVSINGTGNQSTTFTRLDWTIPNITFAAEGVSIPGGLLEFGGSTVSPSGPKGPTSELAYIQDSQWGIWDGNGGVNDIKTSILVNGGALFNSGDVLECETTFKIEQTTVNAFRLFTIKVSPSSSSLVGTTALQFQIPVSVPSVDNIVTIHMNYKIQRTGSDRFRSKGECFVSNYDPSVSVFKEEVEYSFICTSISNFVLTSSTTWGQNQHIVVIVDDEPSPVISVINHEVKVVKKLI